MLINMPQVMAQRRVDDHRSPLELAKQNDDRIRLYANLASLPMVIVSRLLKYAAQPNTVTVGGDIHLIIIRPDARTIAQAQIPPLIVDISPL